METINRRQGLVSSWLRLHGSTVKELAEFLDVSLSHASSLINKDTVPLHIRISLENFRSADGARIPLNLLPAGIKRKRGPQKGWLDRKLAEARAEAMSSL